MMRERDVLAWGRIVRLNARKADSAWMFPGAHVKHSCRQGNFGFGMALVLFATKTEPFSEYFEMSFTSSFWQFGETILDMLVGWLVPYERISGIGLRTVNSVPYHAYLELYIWRGSMGHRESQV
jgi:hypothetical protein